MRKVIFLTLIVLLNSMYLFAQKAKKMIPFTGMDYMRIMVDADYKTASKNTFKVTIKSIANGKVLWQGSITPVTQDVTGIKQLAFHIKGLKPTLWSPSNPYLYQVTLEQLNGGKVINSLTERAGFRFMERKGGNLYLNGNPIFLRGIAINPPDRGIPKELERSRAFALEYVAFMKSINVNIIRIPDAEEWFDVCDELGMMVFGGNYGSKVAQGSKVEAVEQVGDEGDHGFPRDYKVGVAWYQHEKLGAIAHHPSLMVYAMTNETPFAGKRALEWEAFLDYSFKELKKWDETRVYIANAGYGYGKTGDILDIHRYWGWYYSSPFTFLNIRDNSKIIPFPKTGMPITFTECVGNYTGPDGRYNQTPSHKNPSSQLAWTGHERQDLQAQLADYHQSFTMRQATETFRQLRPVNSDLSGVFPFTILFYNWDTIEKFADMKPKPVTAQVKISYQPVLLSWECWTTNAYAGSTINPVAHIINDSDDFKALNNVKLVYQILDKTKTAVLKDSVSYGKIDYYATTQKSLAIKLPQNLLTGDYSLTGKVYADGKLVSENFFNLFIADQQFTAAVTQMKAPAVLYDVKGKTKAALSKLKVPFIEISSFKAIPVNSFLIIGENSADNNVATNANDIKAFIKNGGRVLSLRQDSLSLININNILDFKLTNNKVDIDNPVYPTSSLPPRNGYYVNPERPEHPVFSGITRANLRVWSDYTAWNPTKAGQPSIYPVTDGFQLQDKNAVGLTSILGNFSSGLQSIALAEQFMGKGSILLNGFDLANRSGLDPVADRILLNAISYMSNSDGHSPYQLITSPIVWGEYETEKGIVTDLYSGFLVNATPRLTGAFVDEGIVVSKEGYQLAGGKGSRFNTRPGLQYVTNGRRPWGPYVQSFGGQPRLGKTPLGEGKFWCQIPEGLNNMSSVVWNPSNEPLTMKIRVNELVEIEQQIQPGDKLVINTPVDKISVGATYTSDRRLVVLQTSFNKK